MGYWGMTFEQLDRLLRRAGAQPDAAEVHGSLCGRLCALGETCLDGWLAESLEGTEPDDALAAELRRSLETLHGRDVARLGNGDPAFMPLLPADDTGLKQRVGALGHWCQGFLQGLAHGRVPDPETLAGREQAPHTAEIMNDFVEIARVGFAPQAEDADAEQAEDDYVQLVEYARVGAQLAFEELTRWRARGAEARPAPRSP